MGATQIRFGKVKERMVRGEKSVGGLEMSDVPVGWGWRGVK